MRHSRVSKQIPFSITKVLSYAFWAFCNKCVTYRGKFQSFPKKFVELIFKIEWGKFHMSGKVIRHFSQSAVYKIRSSYPSHLLKQRDISANLPHSSSPLSPISRELIFAVLPFFGQISYFFEGIFPSFLIKLAKIVFCGFKFSRQCRKTAKKAQISSLKMERFNYINFLAQPRQYWFVDNMCQKARRT